MLLKFNIFIFCAVLFYSSFLFSQFNNVQISKPGSNAPEEVTIAINRQNPQEMAAGANIHVYYNSSDAGNTWTQNNLFSTFGVWGDPCVIYDTTGNLYFGHLSNPQSGEWIDRIVVQKSTNNGGTWDTGTGIGWNFPKNQDKEWMAVDRTVSINAGNIYLAWTEFDTYGSSISTDSTRILFSRTTDEGVSWSEAIRISDIGGDAVDKDNTVEGAVPAVAPNGDVYLSWAGPLGLVFDKSTDGGLTFGNDKIVTNIPGGWDFGIPGISRANGLPVTACDNSDSPYRGNIYINWSDQRNGTDNTDIFIMKSTDAGATWSDVIKVNDDDTESQQFFTWMSVDETSGNIYVVYYDRRATTGVYTDVYLARSTDGGDTFNNYQISNESFLPNRNVFFGDYINVDAYNGVIRPIWMRMDNNILSVWTALLNDSLFNTTITNFSTEPIIFDVNISWINNDSNVQSFDIERKYQNEIVWSTIANILPDTANNYPNFTYTDQNLAAGQYVYRIKQINNDSTYSYTKVKTVFVMGALGVDENKLPIGFVLRQNYPNPFNPSTVISFKLPKRMYVKLEVFNMLGQKISTLLNGYKTAGNHEAIFDTGALGRELSSGIYIYSLTADEYHISRKMEILK